MSRIYIYTIHTNPSLLQPYEAAVFIPEGFNWKAFVFGGFWALYHRLWWIALGLFAYNICMAEMVAGKMLSDVGFSVIQIGVHLIIGYQANDWRRAKLKRKGYITADVVTGNSLLAAELRFFDRYFTNHASAPFVA